MKSEQRRAAPNAATRRRAVHPLVRDGRRSSKRKRGDGKRRSHFEPQGRQGFRVGGSATDQMEQAT